jgi:hypothetical protein
MAFCGRCGAGLTAKAPSLSEARAAMPPAGSSRSASAFEPSYARDDDGAGGDLAIGFALVLLGLGVTAVTYAAAEPGGTFLVFWGPAVFGAWRILCGVAKLVRL